MASVALHPPNSTQSIQSLQHSAMFLTRYLVCYNVFMTAGWLLVLIRLVQALRNDNEVYPAVELPLQIAQTGALLEILHSLTGIIRASAATTAMQVSSRLMLLWGVVYAVPEVRTNLSFTTMVLAWSLTEIPRYFYFSISSLAPRVPFWLVWLRYSTFLPLYPMGASSEWLTLYGALPFIKSSGLFSIYMPNSFNFSFDFYAFCVFTLLIYFPGLPYMYTHMMRQRRKYATPPLNKATKTS